MHRFFVPQNFGNEMIITGVDAKHISKVLRMTLGDELQIVSDDGVTAQGKISFIDAACVKVGSLKIIGESNEPKVKITLAQGLAKGEKMDFIIQKAVELGVTSIVPVAMEHSVVQLDGAKAIKKVERWQKISESAAKQSKRNLIPLVQPVMSVEEMLAKNNCL